MKHDYAGAIEYMGSFGLSTVDEESNAIKQTVIYALKLAKKLEEEPSEDMHYAGDAVIDSKVNMDGSYYEDAADECFKAMVEQMKKEVE